MDNRLGERVVIQRAIRLISTRPRTASIGRLVNLSRSGACIVDCELQLFSLVHVDFHPQEGAKQPETTITGYVTRVSDQSAGIEWCEFAPPVVVALLQTETNMSAALAPVALDASADAKCGAPAPACPEAA